MRRHRVGWIASILLALGVSGVSTRASETPIYFVTEGTAGFTSPFNLDTLIFSFSGPGFSISGGEATPEPGRVTEVGVTAGSISASTVISQLFSDELVGSGTVGGIVYPQLAFSSGIVRISGDAPLPNPSITIGFPPGLVVSGDASFSGSLTACAPFNECITGLGGTNIFTLVFDDKGTAQFNISGPFIPCLYDVSNESFTISSQVGVTPEPGTCLMFATGLLMIGLVLGCKHQVLAVDGAPILRC